MQVYNIARLSLSFIAEEICIAQLDGLFKDQEKM